MHGTNNRRIKILGVGWLGLGGLTFAYVLINLFSLAQGNAPSAEELSDGYWVFFLGALVIGVIGAANGLALLRRSSLTRPVLAISSLVLLLPSIGLVVPVLVVAPSLWLTLSGGGKEAFESYMAKENGRERVALGQAQNKVPRPYGVRTFEPESSS